MGARTEDRALIRLERPLAEPPSLAEARATRLPALRAIVAALPQGATSPPQNTEFEGYRDASLAALSAIVGNKCWYCEKGLEGERDPVEHFRPKQRASRVCTEARDGYWWLAWTWQNLMLICADCNGQKLTWFPLEQGSIPLTAEQQPPGQERPLLIDPTEIDPLDHIVFAEDRGGLWRARPRSGSRLGATTIEKLGLDGIKKRPGIVGVFKRHVTTVVQPRVDALELAMRTDDQRLVVEQWTRLCRVLLSKTSTYAALSHCALDARVPSELRRRWGLVLPRPPWTPTISACVSSS